MTSMTPIRIRGKRNATADEKWSARKTRKLEQPRPSPGRSPSVLSASSDTDLMKRRKRIQTHTLSRLEQLPTEILQAIFVFSENPNLPMTSPRLASQLKSAHLHQELTSRILEAVIGGKASSQSELTNASRLMNSRFFTWPFFENWLDALGHTREMDFSAGAVWLQLPSHRGIPPPTKLFAGPFTKDKTRFLSLMAVSWMDVVRGERPAWWSPYYRELLERGALQAVAEGSVDALRTFFNLGIRPTQELFRRAIVEHGCDQRIIECLHDYAFDGERCHIDFLDATIWSWAEKARADGDDIGRWLMNELKAGAKMQV